MIMSFCEYLLAHANLKVMNIQDFEYLSSTNDNFVVDMLQDKEI